MICSDLDTGGSQGLAANQFALLVGRLDALQKVTDMAAGGATRLLGHTRQLQGTVEQLCRQMESIPDPAQVSLLVERMESAQAMLDWLTTRSVPSGNPVDVGELQTRLSISRIALVNLQAEIQQASMLARGVQETREALAGLLSEIETLTSTQAKAESLLQESKLLSANMKSDSNA